MVRGPKTWLITDTHFYHDMMVTECGWPENYVKKIIGNCRRLIGEQDILIHLGDVIFYKYPNLIHILNSVSGRKVLLMGNHDRKSRGWYMRNGFDFATDRIVLDGVILSHEPIIEFSDDVMTNIHGHYHEGGHRDFPWWYNERRHRWLSIEREDFCPVEMQEFLSRS